MSYAYSNSSRLRLPYIRLSGKYLLERGFRVGDAISVVVEENQIMILKEGHASANKGQ